jgi:hypothetical protein
LFGFRDNHISGGTIMELYTVASVAEKVGCTPSRIKGWMQRGLIPEKRIQLGKVRARVVDAEALPLLKRVLEGIEREGLTVPAAFERYFDQEASVGGGARTRGESKSW